MRTSSYFTEQYAKEYDHTEKVAKPTQAEKVSASGKKAKVNRAPAALNTLARPNVTDNTTEGSEVIQQKKDV